LFEVFLESLQTLYSSFECVYVLAEGETPINFPNVGMFLTIKLAKNNVSRMVTTDLRCAFTSLTGMEETPISIAMNHDTLFITCSA